MVLRTLLSDHFGHFTILLYQHPLYYWKGLKPMVRKHVQACKFCQEHNKQAVKYSKYNFEAEPVPMKFISMDLISEFHPPSTKGNRYA